MKRLIVSMTFGSSCLPFDIALKNVTEIQRNFVAVSLSVLNVVSGAEI